jgi:hypothetical protein
LILAGIARSIRPGDLSLEHASRTTLAESAGALRGFFLRRRGHGDHRGERKVRTEVRTVGLLLGRAGAPPPRTFAPAPPADLLPAPPITSVTPSGSCTVQEGLVTPAFAAPRKARVIKCSRNNCGWFATATAIEH